MEMFEQLFMVAAVLGVLCGGLWLLKRKGWAYTSIRAPRGDGQQRLEVLDRLVLSPHHSLHLVRMADRTLLIGLSPNGCNLIDGAPASTPVLGRER